MSGAEQRHTVRRRLQRVVNLLLRPTGFRAVLEPSGVSRRKVGYRRYCQVIEEHSEYVMAVEGLQLPVSRARTDLLGRLEGVTIREALHLVHELAASLEVEGDVCELGCAAGATSAVLADAMRSTEKNLWLFDSFQGLPRPGPQDELLHDVLQLGSIEAYEGAMSFPEASVRRRLDEVGFERSRTRIVPGFIEETLSSPPLPDEVCFAYVDLDFYEPIRIALEFLAPRLATHGRIVIDDYGRFSAGAQRAVDEFVGGRAGRFEVRVDSTARAAFAVLRKLG